MKLAHVSDWRRGRSWALLLLGRMLRMTSICLVLAASAPLAAAKEDVVPKLSPSLHVPPRSAAGLTATSASRDGKVVAVSSDYLRSTFVVETQTGRIIGTVPASGKVAISSEGARVALAHPEGTISLWRTAPVERLQMIKADAPTSVTSIAINDAGTRLVVGDRRRWVRCLDLSSGAELWRLQLPNEIQALAVSKGFDVVLVGYGSGALTSGAREDGGSVLVDGRTGVISGSLDVPPGYGILSVALSADGRRAATVRENAAGVRLWNVSRKRLERVVAKQMLPSAVALSDDGSRLALGTAGLGIYVLKTSDGLALWHREKVDENVAPDAQLTFVQEGRALYASDDFSAVMLDASQGEVVQRPSEIAANYGIGPVGLSSVALSSNGRYLKLQGRDYLGVWDLQAGQLQTLYPSLGQPAETVCAPTDLVFSPVSAQAITFGGCGELRVVDLDAWTSKPLEAPTARGWPATRMVNYSPKGRFVQAELYPDTSISVWDVASGKRVSSSTLGKMVTLASGFSNDETRRWALIDYDVTYQRESTAQVVVAEVSSGKEISRSTIELNAWEYVYCQPVMDRAGSIVMYSDPIGKLHLFDALTRSDTEVLDSTNESSCPTLSQDGKWVAWREGGDLVVATPRPWTEKFRLDINDDLRFLGESLSYAFSRSGTLTVTDGGHIRRVRMDTGAVDGSCEVAGQEQAIDTLLALDDRVVASAKSQLIICDLRKGIATASLYAFANGAWLVTDPEGRFETNEMAALTGVSWVMPDDPFVGLPLESYMREYFQPALLSMSSSPTPLPALPDVQDLNRAQPDVRITEVRSNGSKYTPSVDVVVSVGGSITSIEGSKRSSTGAFDVRLLRDGRVVRQEPAFEAGTSAAVASDLDDRSEWRRVTRVADSNERRQITFEDVPLPKGNATGNVELGVYAFNDDRVKTVTTTHPISVPASEIMGQAFILAIGVNEYGSTAWNLDYAAKDAEQIAKALSAGFAAGGYEVPPPTLLLAKANIRNAGKNAIKEALSELAKRVTPDDIVVVFYSGHGYSDRRGNLMLLPGDSDPSKEPDWDLPSEETLRRLISADDLEAWIRPIDAKRLILVLDSCYSSASIKTPGFKAAPLGARGLGQLAYDKRMMVLAASQADAVAREFGGDIEHGLLTYALLHDGLQARQARNLTGRLTVRSLLAYAARRVPSLAVEIRSNTLNTFGLNPPKRRDARPPQRTNTAPPVQQEVQTPTFFDFSGGATVDAMLEASPRGLLP